MKIELVDQFNAIVEGFYKVTIDQAHIWMYAPEDKHYPELIEEFAANKSKFTTVTRIFNTSQPTIFATLLDYELEAKKDIAKHTYNEILEVLRSLSKRGIFTSKSTYNAYINTIFHYTDWGYHMRLREDIITIEDITKKFTVKNALDKESLKDKTMTWLEMKSWINKCSPLRVIILLTAALEGLKPSEVLEIKITEFKNEKNHPLQLEERVVEVSDELYSKMYEHSKEFEGLKRVKSDTDKLTPYTNSGYLIRSFNRATSPIRKMNTNGSSLIIKQEFNGIGYNGKSVDFRTSSILNDALDGYTIDQINSKYGLKFQFLDGLDKTKLEIVKEKRRMESK